MNELTFTDIFIGENGFVVLLSSMLLALGGSLFKKYKRYNSLEKKNTFNLTYWIKDNWDDMLVGFFVTYILVRLLNVVTPYTLTYLNIDGVDVAASDILVIVSIFIGYYSDSILEKIIPKRN